MLLADSLSLSAHSERLTNASVNLISFFSLNDTLNFLIFLRFRSIRHFLRVSTVIFTTKILLNFLHLLVHSVTFYIYEPLLCFLITRQNELVMRLPSDLLLILLRFVIFVLVCVIFIIIIATTIKRPTHYSIVIKLLKLVCFQHSIAVIHLPIAFRQVFLNFN